MRITVDSEKLNKDYLAFIYAYLLTSKSDVEEQHAFNERLSRLAIAKLSKNKRRSVLAHGALQIKAVIESIIGPFSEASSNAAQSEQFKQIVNLWRESSAGDRIFLLLHSGGSLANAYMHTEVEKKYIT